MSGLASGNVAESRVPPGGNGWHTRCTPYHQPCGKVSCRASH